VNTRREWEEIKPLGGGGQSDVYLVRRPERATARKINLQKLKVLSGLDLSPVNAADFAKAVFEFAQPDEITDFAAIKVFKLDEAGPEGEKEARNRMKQEIAVLQLSRQGLPQLLDFNDTEGWIVTEYFPEGTLFDHPHKYKGKAILALRAFRSLVQTAASLHKDGLVHRDIKPANVFLRRDDELVLGDFGIVYAPNASERITRSLERVGPRDYMPQWANLGSRHENVQPNFDVYMLGKLLWSMIDGRPVLPREFFEDPEYDFDLTKTFPNDPQMHAINRILAKCVVDKPRECLSSATDLLSMVDTLLLCMDRGGQLLTTGVPRPCHVCGVGFYQSIPFPTPRSALPSGGNVGLRFWYGAGENLAIHIQPFSCDKCGHVELFTRPLLAS
jgi:serine/threonine protein kinase